MRKAILAGNWKMYKTNAEARQFMEQGADYPSRDDLELIICAPFTALSTLVEHKGNAFAIGAQNMHDEVQGAFTGEISPVMLQSIGVQYVIIGHSERRTYFHETDEWIAKKVQSAFAHQLTPILCVGETLEQYEAGQTEAVVHEQTVIAIRNLLAEQVQQLVIAYEPVWAIGTGKTATAADANKVIAYIRRTIAEQFGPQTAEQVRILYGGSVKPDNIAHFMAESDIDGALVGGASLQIESFLQMSKAIEG